MATSATLNGTINNGTPPYSIIVRKEGEVVGNRCTQNCTQLPVSFNIDEGVHRYYGVITDSNNCVNSTGFSNPLGCADIVPTLTYELIQPACVLNTTTVIPAKVVVKNMANAKFYKVCSGKTFVCADGCTSPTGNLTSDNITIDLPSAQAGQTFDYTIRFYNNCTTFKDIQVSILGIDCSVPEVRVYNIDFILYQMSYNSNKDAKCNQPLTYYHQRDFYIEDVTTGSVTQGQKAQISTNDAVKNVPNGNKVPNISFGAALKASCGNPGSINSVINLIFYRFAFNLPQIVAANPTINIFNYAVYQKLVKTDVDLKYPKMIRILESKFEKTSLVYSIDSLGQSDLGRNPDTAGPQVTRDPDVAITSQSVGEPFNRIGTIVFNRQSNSIQFNTP